MNGIFLGGLLQCHQVRWDSGSNHQVFRDGEITHHWFWTSHIFDFFFGWSPMIA